MDCTRIERRGGRGGADRGEIEGGQTRQKRGGARSRGTDGQTEDKQRRVQTADRAYR